MTDINDLGRTFSMPTVSRCRLLFATLSVVPLAALAGCGSGSDSSSSNASQSTTAGALNLKLGIVSGATGSQASIGQPFIANAKLGAETINEQLQKAGLADKYKVTITGTGDTQGQAQSAIAACKKAVDIDGSQGIIGDFASSTTIACAQSVLIPKGIPAFSGGSSPALTLLNKDHLIWRTLPSDAYGGQVAAQYLADKFGPGATINLGYENDAFGQAFHQVISDAMSKRGLKVGNSVALTTGATSFTTEAEKLTTNKPDGWFFVIYCDEWGKLRPQLEQSGSWSPDKTVTSAEANQCPKPAQLSKGVTGIESRTTGGAGYDAYTAAYKAGSNPPNQESTTPAFDGVYLAFLASVAAKSTDPAKWKDQVKAVSGPKGEAFNWQQLPEAVKALEAGKQIAYKGVSGDFNYDDLGNMTTGTFSIWAANGQGNRTTVKPIQPDANVKAG
jgi:branched-chain amino acid transport system substrate-binding protein